MKPTYDCYSKSFIGLKAAILALLIPVISLPFELGHLDVGQYKDSCIGFATAISIFVFDNLFNYLIIKVNAIEIFFHKKKIEKQLTELTALEKSCDAATQKKIRKQIAKLREVQLALIG